MFTTMLSDTLKYSYFDGEFIYMKMKEPFILQKLISVLQCADILTFFNTRTNPSL